MDSKRSLLEEADAAYSRVVLDPARYTEEAREFNRRARSAGDTEALVVGLRAEAWGRHALLDNENARKLLDQGVRLAVRHELPHRLGDLLVTRSVALQELGRYEAAARDLRRAEPLVAPAQVPDLRLQLAVLDHNRGRIQAAARAYRELLDDPACPPFVWVKAANNLANAETQLGRPQAALDYLDRAAALAKEMGPHVRAAIANSHAWSSFRAGRMAESVGRFEETGQLLAAADLPLGEHLMEYTDVLRDLRLLDEATVAARSAAVEFERHGARLMAAEARLQCARLALDSGDAAAAWTDAEAACRDFRRQRRTAWAARATVALAEAQAARDGYSPEGLRRLRDAANTLQRQGLRAESAYGHLAAGRAALALGEPVVARRELTRAGELADGQSLLVRLRGHLARALLAEAEDSGSVLRECARGLRDLARHRAALPSLELRVLAAGHGAELGDVGLRRLLPTAPASRIFEWLERTRSAALMSVQPPAAAGLDEDVIALRGIESELRTARQERDDEPPALLARQSALETRIRRRSWSGEEVGGDAGPRATTADVRRALDGARLVEYTVIDERVLAVVVEPRRSRVIELGPVAPILHESDAALHGLRRLLNGTAFASAATAATQEALDALAKQLIAPLGVPDDAPLVVVPSILLLGVLWSPLHPAPVSVAPSASLWLRARHSSARGIRGPVAGPDRAGGVAVVAGPDRAGAGAVVAGPDRVGGVAVVAGPDLAGAVEEANAVAAEYPDASILLPPDSTVDATVGLIKEAGLAHLACHGRFRSDSPMFSALELSDGQLTLYEMLSRGAVPRRLVLASCNSGTQRPYDGNEVLGFVSAMMSNGSAGIAATEIPIPDGASASAMTVLHRRVSRGDSLASAVWQARASLAGGGPEEFIAWCGLTAYGPG